MEQQPSDRYIAAQKRVARIKGFYRHLTIYIIANIALIVLKVYAFDFFPDYDMTDESFRSWLGWNIVLTPIFWGLGLLFHGLHVFAFKSKPLKELLKPPFVKRWEERQIQKYMDGDGQKKE
ncbi:2TM domain-containing protein [Flavobacteriaceae bacterium 3-367]|uniref:2TM domain-containing protein n=1 Tax=Eudoraea algarum TaxID=3417568 RepID=UPI0032849564